MDLYAVQLARRARPARDRESQAAQHARHDLPDIAQPHDADPLVERGVRLLERVPAPLGLGGGEPVAVAQDREGSQADIFAHALRRLFGRHAHDRYVARQVGIAGDVIDAGGAAEDHAQVGIARQPTRRGFPDQDMGDGVAIDRGIVPPAHGQPRGRLGEARLPLGQRGGAAGLHQQQAVRHRLGFTIRVARSARSADSPCCA